MTDTYYERRQRESLAMMDGAANSSCARIIHKRLALEYGKLAEASRAAKAFGLPLASNIRFATAAAGGPANDGAAAVRHAS